MQNQTLGQVISTLQQANNVLVTVKKDPSIDELASAVGLTLALNKEGKHATTVFSGKVPSTIEFLQPETVIDSTTDSLRDFIISLDKSKADKLRYKVEDNVVRIFITPYRSTITSDDLEFTQGDFNVDAVVAIGVVSQQDFDTAVASHGRIMHDATVISMTKRDMPSQIGAINWHEPMVSSVSEMAARVVDGMNPQLLDGQMATAFLTGVIAETDRFRNSYTTPAVMSLSSRLMMAGANQQLVAEELEKPEEIPFDDQIMPAHEAAQQSADGTLEIAHSDEEDALQSIHIDEDGTVAAGDDMHQDAFGSSEKPADSGRQDVSEALEKPIKDSGLSYVESPLSTLPPRSPQLSDSLPESASTESSNTPPAVPPASEFSAANTPQVPSVDAPASKPPEAPSDNDDTSSLPPLPKQEPLNASVHKETQGHQLLQENKPEENSLDEGGDNIKPASNVPVMQHKHKTLQPISDEFKSKTPTLPVKDIANDSADTSADRPAELEDKLEKIRQSINSSAQETPKPKQNIGAMHFDLEKSEPPTPVSPPANTAPAPPPPTVPPPPPPPPAEKKQPEPASSAPTMPAQEPPKPLVYQDQPEVEDSTKPPAVPPPMMPPSVAGAGPQFYDADGQKTDPLTN